VGFPNLHDYFRKEFKDPETGKEPTNGLEFTEYNLKIQTAPLWDGKKDVGGDKIKGWAEFRKRGMWNSSRYKYKSRWGKFKTKTHKFEFYSDTLKAALESHAKKHNIDVDGIMEVTNYTARGDLCFVPHYEPPFRYGDEKEYPFVFIDYKSRLNREGRSQNASWYQEFKHVDIGDVGWEDVLKINPDDARKLGIKDADMVKISTVTGSYRLRARLWEGLRPGTVTKCFGQGHWAYGRVAAKDYGKAVPRGVNNNEIMPFVTERLSGSNVRNGGFTGVKIEKA
jgi:anaerobic selenocysteine-containing dehydrogenase